MTMGVIVTASLICGSVLAQETDPFYERLLSRGKLEYGAGNYTEAVSTLRIAAFGLLNDLSAYEEAQIYRALSEQGRGELEEARMVIRSIFHAESVQRVYPPADLDPAVQVQFEAAVNRLFPERVFPDTTPIEPPVVELEEQPSVDETVDRIEEYTTLLNEDLARRDEALARANAALQSIIERDPDDTEAHLLLARIAAERGEWGVAAEHCGAAVMEEILATEDAGTLLVCQVSLNDTEAAGATALELDDSARRRFDVISALEQLDVLRREGN